MNYLSMGFLVTAVYFMYQFAVSNVILLWICFATIATLGIFLWVVHNSNKTTFNVDKKGAFLVSTSVSAVLVFLVHLTTSAGLL